jgi:hypothetical protein
LKPRSLRPPTSVTRPIRSAEAAVDVVDELEPEPPQAASSAQKPSSRNERRTIRVTTVLPGWWR